jgi:hypothetical protein
MTFCSSFSAFFRFSALKGGRKLPLSIGSTYPGEFEIKFENNFIKVDNLEDHN